MSQIQKPKYYTSVLLNFILIAVVIGVFVTKDSENTTKFSIINANETNRVSALEGHNAAASYKEFLALGLSEEQAKVLVLHSLHSELNNSLPESSNEFWHESPHKEQIMLIASSFEINDKLRDSLLSEFGAEAKSDPLFRQIFFPLDIQYPFLSSTEQIALQKLQFEQQRNMLGGIPRQANAQVQNPADILSSESWHEFQLRVSPVAEGLRQSGVGFDESSFRQTVTILTGGSSSPNSRQVIFDDQSASALMDLLGHEAVFRLRTQFDPQFANLVQAGRQHNLSDQDISIAHQVIAEHDPSIADAYQQRQFDSDAGTKQMYAAVQERREQLVSLFGDEATDALLRPKPQQPDFLFQSPDHNELVIGSFQHE